MPPHSSPPSTNLESQVLIVDDAQSLREGFELVLSTEGHQTITSPDGPSTVDKLTQDTSPDLMVLDLRMPGMDGLEVLRRLDPAQVPPTIIASAYMDSGTAMEAIQLGVVDFLIKPILPSDLRQAVAQVLKEESAFREHQAEADLENALPSMRCLLRRRRLSEAKTLLGQARDSAVPGVQFGLWQMILHHLSNTQLDSPSTSPFVSSRFYTASNILDYLAYNASDQPE